MKKRFLILSALSLALLASQACGLVNVENIDSIDTTSTLGKGTEVTVFTEKTFTLKDFIKAEASGSVLQVSQDGEFSISKSLGSQNLGDGFSFDASAFVLNAGNTANPFYQGINLSEAVIPAKTPLKYDEADKAAVELYFQNFASGVDIAFFQSLLSQKYEFKLENLDFSINNFPELIKEFMKADLDGNFILNLVPAGIPFDKVVFNQGLEISFPAFLKFASCDNDGFEIVNGNVLKAVTDIDVPIGTGLSLSLELQSLDMGNGTATNKKLELGGSVEVKGTVSINPADFNGEKEEINLASYPVIAPYLSGDGSHTIEMVKSDTPIDGFDVTCSYSASNVSLQNATIKLSKDAIPSFDGANNEFPVGNLGSFFGEGAEVKLAEVQVKLAVDSKLPFAFGLNANLATMTGQTVHHEYALGPLQFDANKLTTYSLGTHQDGQEGDVTYKHVEGLGGLLSPVPEKIVTKDFNILYDENQWLTVESGKNYGGTFDVGVEAPVSFTSDTKLSFNIPVDDVDLDLSITGNKIKGETLAEIKMKVTNTMPLDFTLDVIPKDASKNRIEGIKVSMEPQAIGAGSMTQPWNQDVVISVILPASSNLIKSIGFDMNASSNDAFAGTRLNHNMSISLKDVKFCLPNGITTDLKDIVK